MTVQILKSFLLGSAFCAPLIALDSFQSGKVRVAIVWCIAASAEVAAALVLEVIQINARNRRES